MSTGISAKGNQDNARFTACLDERRHSSTNDVDNNPDLFLAASLQFLHRLLAKRTLQCARLDAGSIPTTRRDVEDVQEQGNNIRRQLHYQQIDQIEEYRRQLRNMEDFLYNIRVATNTSMRDTSVYDAVMTNETKITGRDENQRNFRSTTLNDDLCDFISQDPTPRASTYPYSSSNYDDELGVEAPATANLFARERTSNAPSDFTGCLETHSVVPTSSGPTNSIQSTASYADILRNAVSGLARNCRRKCKNRSKKHVAESWLSRAGIVRSSKEEWHREGCLSEVESETSSEWQLCDEHDSDISKEIPLRVQLAMETDASPREPVTLLVKVPNTVFNLLNRKVSNGDRKIPSKYWSMETSTESNRRKKRITSMFRNLFNRKRTPSSIRQRFCKGDSANDTSRSSLIYTLQKTAACESFDRKKSAENSCGANNEASIKSRSTECTSNKCMFVPPTENINGYEKVSLNMSPRVISYETKPWNGKAAGSTWRNLADDKAVRAGIPSDKAKILNGWTNYCGEKIIPLRCSEGSPQKDITRGEISQRDVDTFLELAAEIRKTQVGRDAEGKNVEIPVEIKTMKTPLHLRRIQNVPQGFLDHCDYQPVSTSAQNTRNGLERQDFLEMLVGTLPEGDHHPQLEYSKSKELPPALDSTRNEPQDNTQLRRKSEDSALEVLLRHIATDASTTSCVKQYAAEKDTTAQTAPKRQLSKLSVCCSSESMSGSDHENPELRIRNPAISRDEYRVYNSVLGQDSRKPGNRRHHCRCENAEENYTCCSVDDQVVSCDERKNSLTGAKIRSSTGYNEVAEIERSDQYLSPARIQAERNLVPCSRTEVIIEEENCSTVEAEAEALDPMDKERTFLSIRETEKSLFCHPVLSRQICGDNKELEDAMIRWWGPQINYSTTPSSQTQLSAYSISINNLM